MNEPLRKLEQRFCHLPLPERGDGWTFKKYHVTLIQSSSNAEHVNDAKDIMKGNSNLVVLLSHPRSAQ